MRKGAFFLTLNISQKTRKALNLMKKWLTRTLSSRKICEELSNAWFLTSYCAQMSQKAESTLLKWPSKGTQKDIYDLKATPSSTKIKYYRYCPNFVECIFCWLEGHFSSRKVLPQNDKNKVSIQWYAWGQKKYEQCMGSGAKHILGGKQLAELVKNWHLKEEHVSVNMQSFIHMKKLYLN